MPRGIPKNASRSGTINKAELIRTTAKSMGKDVRPKDIVAALKEQGVIVSSPMVSKTLHRAGSHRSRRGKKGTAGRRSAGKNAAAASGSTGETSKAQRIRDVAKSLGKKVRPRDVIAELATEGITVSSAQVSTTLRAAGYRRKRLGTRGATAGAKSASSNGLNLDALLAAKGLIAKVGSVEIAQEALAVLKKLE